MESIHHSLGRQNNANVASAFALPVRVLTTVVELTAATLLVGEVGVLLTGVIWRYFLDSPLTWTDELASTLFTWLAMLGAVLALARGEHMRMTAVVKRFSPTMQRWCEMVSQLVVALFAAFILLPAAHHASEQMSITTPALGISDGLRALGLPVGAALMLLISIANIIKTGSRSHTVSGLAALLFISVALWLLQPSFIAMGNLNLLIFFVFLVGAGVLIGVPIGFAFGMSTVAYLTLVTHAPLGIVVSRMDEGMSHLILLAVPIFVLLGSLIELSGLARHLVDFMASLLGHVRGGLQYVLLGAMFLVSGISGSKAADMAAIAPALFPEMKARGVKGDDLAALLSASGAMTETIPPSLVLITIGAVCSVSISALFVGGLLPALIATIAIASVCWVKARRADAPTLPRAPIRTILRTFLVAIPALALPLLIRSAVVEGVATATEVSTLGVVYTLIAGIVASLFGKPFSYNRLYKIVVDAATLSGAILLIIGLATSMAWALTRSGFSIYLVNLMQSVPGGAAGFMVVTIVCFAVLGSVLEGIPAIVLFGPLLFPVARSLHINDVHYSMVVILAMGLGLFAPPFGVGFYAACAIGKTSPDGVGKKIWAYMLALLIALVFIAFVPWISTVFLPEMPT
jgi:tripartite ATP-independent transporter DctM subunit